MTLWTNFAGDQSCEPAAFDRPRNRRELGRAIAAAAAADRTVRVAGAGHSFTDAVLTDGTLVSLDRLDRVIDVDRGSGLVRVEAGIRLGALSEILWEHGLAFTNLGDIDVQSLAGAASTGTHGTGLAHPNISASLQSIELMLADGSVIELGPDSDHDGWRAARISIGALGVITAATLRAVPAFTLDSVETTAPIERTLDDFGELVTRNDHFGLFTFPHSDLAIVKASNRVDSAPRPRPRPLEWFDDVAMTNYAFWGICLLGRVRPRLIPSLNRLTGRLAGTTRVRDRSYRVFRTPRRVPITEMEYAIPLDRAAEAVRSVRAVAESTGFDVPVPIEVRAAAPDDAFLSPAQGRETCWIAVHQFGGLDFERWFRAAEEVLLSFGGRPHWGKRHFRVAEQLRGSYPDWEGFAAVRARLDPGGRFTNSYVERVLGPAR
ncbi:MAG: D-arabinono-1,4-lactone oxidase [Solirubrobacterales bacterium]